MVFSEKKPAPVGLFGEYDRALRLDIRHRGDDGVETLVREIGRFFSSFSLDLVPEVIPLEFAKSIEREQQAFGERRPALAKGVGEFERVDGFIERLPLGDDVLRSQLVAVELHRGDERCHRSLGRFERRVYRRGYKLRRFNGRLAQPGRHAVLPERGCGEEKYECEDQSRSHDADFQKGRRKLVYSNSTTPINSCRTGGVDCH